jgi:hypothetical protein
MDIVILVGPVDTVDKIIALHGLDYPHLLEAHLVLLYHFRLFIPVGNQMIFFGAFFTCRAGIHILDGSQDTAQIWGYGFGRFSQIVAKNRATVHSECILSTVYPALSTVWTSSVGLVYPKCGS